MHLQELRHHRRLHPGRHASGHSHRARRARGAAPGAAREMGARRPAGAGGGGAGRLISRAPGTLARRATTSSSGSPTGSASWDSTATGWTPPSTSRRRSAPSSSGRRSWHSRIGGEGIRPGEPRRPSVLHDGRGVRLGGGGGAGEGVQFRGPDTWTSSLTATTASSTSGSRRGAGHWTASSRGYSAALHDGSLNGVAILNYISSHDDGSPYDQERKDPLGAGTRLLLAPGGAQIYYGDELARPLRVAGAEGDANLRSFMNWEDLERGGRPGRCWSTGGSSGDSARRIRRSGRGCTGRFRRSRTCSVGGWEWGTGARGDGARGGDEDGSGIRRVSGWGRGAGRVLRGPRWGGGWCRVGPDGFGLGPSGPAAVSGTQMMRLGCLAPSSHHSRRALISPRSMELPSQTHRYPAGHSRTQTRAVRAGSVALSAPPLVVTRSSAGYAAR